MQQSQVREWRAGRTLGAHAGAVDTRGAGDAAVVADTASGAGAPARPSPRAAGRPPASSHPRTSGFGSVRPVHFTYPRAPMMIYWEVTIACALACRHCRARAWRRPAPGELTTAQAVHFLDDVTRFGRPYPHVILTGGDPLRRADLSVLMTEARRRGIGTSVAPAVTPLLTLERLARLKADGAHAVSLSLDGSTAARHDGLRRVPGTFDATIRALDQAAQVGLPVQVNTLVTADTAPDLPAIYRLLTTKRLARWTLFFLVRTGRGALLREVEPAASERIMNWLLDLRREAPFHVSTTEALHFRRVAAQRMERAGMTREQVAATPLARAFGIHDGNGIVFVGHTGDVTPSSFLPLAIGNVKRDSIADLYQHHPVIRALRDPARLRGRCGACPYNRWCGGSRSRAYADAGDYLAADPLCPYDPARAAA